MGTPSFYWPRTLVVSQHSWSGFARSPTLLHYIQASAPAAGTAALAFFACARDTVHLVLQLTVNQRGQRWWLVVIWGKLVSLESTHMIRRSFGNSSLNASLALLTASMTLKGPTKRGASVRHRPLCSRKFLTLSRTMSPG